MRTAFVLGGGGRLGAHEVGMLRALARHGVRPDLVLGTSVGAINGAAVAADPSPEGIARLEQVWLDIGRSDALGTSVLGRLRTLARTRTHVQELGPLRALLAERVPVERIEDLPVPFACVAACIERAAEHWFEDGPLVDAVLASCAVPGLLPPVRIGDEHFIDGGIVNSIPVRRAVDRGADRVFVLHVGRIEHPLEPPRWPWQVGLVAFEVARRHRFLGDLAGLPQDVEVHVLPTGQDAAPRSLDLQPLRGDADLVGSAIQRADEATTAFLQERGA